VTRFIFWQRWLFVVALVIVLFGLALALFNQGAVLAGYSTDTGGDASSQAHSWAASGQNRPSRRWAGWPGPSIGRPAQF
jgi:hypothetical protein